MWKNMSRDACEILERDVERCMRKHGKIYREIHVKVWKNMSKDAWERRRGVERRLGKGKGSYKNIHRYSVGIIQ